MFTSLIKPISITLALTTTFGILIHDTHLDRATTTALTVPLALATFGASEAIRLNLNDPHVHTERVSVNNTLGELRSTQPRLQTRDDKDRSYATVSKFVSDGTGSEYHWPSI